MNPTETQEALLKAATDYNHNPTPQAILDPFKEAILTLRAKFASYEIVTDMLTQHEVQVSIATVRRFCRRNHGEMKRIRNEILAQKKAAAQGLDKGPPPGSSTASNLPLQENSLSQKSPRDLRGPV